MSYMQLKTTFDKITKDVWGKLGDAFEYNISLGETSISDMILLYVVKLNNRNIYIKQTRQNEESKFGTDWVWWIGSNNKGWIAYAVQAKKYNTKNDRYDSLEHKVNGISQSNILERYSNSIQAVPIYALYNHVLKGNFISIISRLKCIQPEEIHGVTLASLNTVKTAVSTRGCRNFRFIHSRCSTITLPELIDQTSHYLSCYQRNSQLKDKLFEVYPKVHEFILDNESTNKKVFIVSTDGEEIQVQVCAKRQLIINIDNYD